MGVVEPVCVTDRVRECVGENEAVGVSVAVSLVDVVSDAVLLGVADLVLQAWAGCKWRLTARRVMTRAVRHLAARGRYIRDGWRNARFR